MPVSGLLSFDLVHAAERNLRRCKSDRIAVFLFLKGQLVQTGDVAVTAEVHIAIGVWRTGPAGASMRGEGGGSERKGRRRHARMTPARVRRRARSSAADARN